MTRTSGQRTLGIAVSADAVRGIVIEASVVTWAHETMISADCSLTEALRAVLVQAIRDGHARRHPVIAIGPLFAQLRRLRHLPSVRDLDALSAIIQESAARYFRQNGTPIVTTPVHRDEHGDGWAGAFEAPVVHSIVEVCSQLKLRDVMLVPTAMMLGLAAPDCAFAWRDGDLTLELRYERGLLRDHRCVPTHLASRDHGDGVVLDASLQAMGERALRFAAAYAAAKTGAVHALGLRPTARTAAAKRATRRLLLAACVCAVAVTMRFGAPMLWAAEEERRALEQLAHSAAGGRAIDAYQVVADSIAVLAELSAFQRSAPSTTLLLASLTHAIEPPTVIVDLKLEVDGGNLTALTPSAATLLAMLGSVSEIRSPTIVGAVTPEVILGASMSPSSPTAAAQAGANKQRLQRVAVRFAWSGEQHGTPTTLAASGPVATRSGR